MIWPWTIYKIEDPFTRWATYGVWVILVVSVSGWFVSYPPWLLSVIVAVWIPFMVISCYRMWRDTRRDLAAARAFIDALDKAVDSDLDDLDALLSPEHQEDMRIWWAKKALRDK